MMPIEFRVNEMANGGFVIRIYIIGKSETDHFAKNKKDAKNLITKTLDENM